MPNLEYIDIRHTGLVKVKVSPTDTYTGKGLFQNLNYPK
jgi:hypothetical protein